MNTNQLKNVVKSTNYTKLIFDDDSELRVAVADTRFEIIEGVEIIYIYPRIREKEYRVLYSSPTLDKYGTSTAQELLDYWESNFFFYDVGVVGTFTFDGEYANYTALTTAIPAGLAGRFAYVLNSQGTSWLPGSLGGTYYGAGWYYDTGSIWANKNDEIFQGLESTSLKNRVRVDQNNYSMTLGGVIDSTKEYFIDGIINVGNTKITPPTGGLLLTGYGFDKSKLISSENAFNLFDTITSGNVFLRGFSLEITGTGSKVFNLTSNTGFEAIEMQEVNFDSCTSLGELNGFRQGLESNTGRFGGTPELTYSGTWIGGYRIETSIALNMNNFTSLFKTGTALLIQGRFNLNINCNLPTTGALIDLAGVNILNKESLILENCFIRRNGVIDSSDTTIYPNIDDTNNKSLWNDNTGIPNTQKYIRQVITTEVTTTINTIGIYEVLLATWTVDSDISHFDSPSNGQLRLQSGNGKYMVSGDISITGTANDVVDVRVVKSTDDGVTWPIVINHIRRQINSLVGGRDVAFFPINFLVSLKDGDRIRIEVENTTSTDDVTAEIDSSFVITQV